MILHVRAVLLGGGTPFFRALPASVALSQQKVVVAPGVTHRYHAVAR